jgi:hypothetical protein
VSRVSALSGSPRAAVYARRPAPFDQSIVLLGRRGECCMLAHPYGCSGDHSHLASTASRESPDNPAATTAPTKGKARPVVPGVDQLEKLKHQVLFLHERGLTTYEMNDWNRQLWLLERLAGGDRSKLDSHLLDRMNGELADATMRQLKATGLLYEWLDAWDARDDAPPEPEPDSELIWPSAPEIRNAPG